MPLCRSVDMIYQIMGDYGIITWRGRIRMLNIFFNNLIYKKYRGLILCIGDLCVVILSFLLSYWARMDFNITRIGEVNLGTALIGFAIVLTVYTICFLAFKIYKSLW